MSLNLLMALAAAYGVALFFILRGAGFFSGRKEFGAGRRAARGNSLARSGDPGPRPSAETPDLNEEIERTEARLNELKLERLRRRHAMGRDRPTEPYRGRVDDRCRTLPAISEDP